MPTAKLNQQQAAELIQRHRGGVYSFAADLFIPLGNVAGRLGDHWGDHQQRGFRAFNDPLLDLAHGRTPSTRRFWIERTKGGSKDSDIAVCILWLLAFTTRPLRIQVGAYDQEQASELRHIIKAFLNIDAPINQLLASRIDVQKNVILGKALTPNTPESICEILTTDAYGAHGARPDVVIANELSHVGSQAFMETLFDNADKVPHSICIVATNAGERGTWQERWREIAQTSDRWFFDVLDKPAEWISESDLAESRLRNPPQRFNRLWYGVWSSGEGDGLDMAKVERAVVLPGPARRSPSKIFLIGCDLAKKRDHAALVTVAVDLIQQVVELADVQSWAPQDFPSGEIELSAVESAALELRERYNALALFFDPWQCHYLAERLQQQGLPAIEVPFVPATRDAMASALVDAFNNDQLKLYRDPALLRDLARIRVKEASHGGLRLDAVRDADGHADRAIALSIVLPAALDMVQCAVRERPESDFAEQLTPV